MEFPDDDFLDDLLCDSSVNKFKRPPAKAVTLVPATADALELKRLKKSALMAELFGPTTLHQSDSNQGQQVHQQVASDRFFSAPLTSVAGKIDGPLSVNKSDEPISISKTDAPVLGGCASTQGSRKSSIQHIENHFERDQHNDDPGLGGHIPSLGTHKNSTQHFENPIDSSQRNREIASELKTAPGKFATEILSADNFVDESAPRPASTLNSILGTYVPSVGDSRGVDRVSSSFLLTAQPAAESGKVQKKPEVQILSESAPKIQLPQHARSQEVTTVGKTAHTDFRNPVQPSNNSVNLNLFKELLDNFAVGFFNQFSSLNGKEEAFKELTCTLVSIEKCLETVSHTLEEKMNNQNTLHEKRISTLESQISDLVKENANLVIKMQILEDESSRNKSEMCAMKSETVSLNTVYQRHVLEMDKVRDEVISLSTGCEQTKEVLQKSSHEQMRHLEDKSNTLQKELSHILRAEVRWLEKWKAKIKKNNHILRDQINRKFQQLDEFSSVISFY